jgi:ABC-type transporter Mla subunit MlaD
MRRAVFLILGSLEFVVAGMVIHLGCQLPGSRDVDQGFERADRVTCQAGGQVRILREQVRDLRRPELREAAERLQKQTHTVTRTLKGQQLDFETVGTMRDALGDVADGLDALAGTLDPVAVGKLGTGLGETADFLDGKIVPGAEKAADQLDASTAALRTDARRLQALLRDAPLDLKAAREIHDSLARFGEGLERMNHALTPQRLDVIREGFRGLETSLTTGADQVERLARYSYPVVTRSGLKPEVQQRQFWPEGDRIAEGMRKAAAGVNAAEKEVDGLAEDLPKLRASLNESHKVVDKTREALALALKQQDKVEPLLKDIPRHAARLADELPQLGSDFARMLRDTRRLREVAEALRQAQKGIDAAVTRWPELRKTLARSATLLKTTRDQLDHALEHRREYEDAMRQSVVLAESFAAMLPLVTDQLDGRLNEEEHALDDLGKSLDEFRDVLPAYQESTLNVLRTGRLLAWLVAAIVGLHGGYSMLSAGMGKRYSV